MAGDIQDVTELAQRIRAWMCIAVEGNAVCADCVTSDAARHPARVEWASANLGVVLCINCCGVHRKLGAHVSKPLSIRMDAWAEGMVAAMEAAMAISKDTP